jgi:hypothetical protein
MVCGEGRMNLFPFGCFLEPRGGKGIKVSDEGILNHTYLSPRGLMDTALVS